MCRWTPTKCGLRDDHSGPCLSPKQLNQLVERKAAELEQDLQKVLGKPT